MKNTNPNHTALAVNMMASLGLPASEAFTIHSADSAFRHGRVLAFNGSQWRDEEGAAAHWFEQARARALATNASQFASGNPAEFLTNYAIRFTDPLQDQLRAVRELLAPEVRSNNSATVTYPVWGYGDAILSLDSSTSNQRAIGADYPTLRNTAHTLTTQTLADTGLAVEVDEEEELLDPDWQQRKVAWLIGINDRTELRAAFALYVAAASNTAKTWDTTAGKDPDQDIETIIASSALRPNSCLFGPGAWSKRRIAHRAQNTAGGFASAKMTPDELAMDMQFNSLVVPRNKYATGASTSSDVIGSYVAMFSSVPGMSRDDFSTMKTFTAPARNGQPRQVLVRQIGDKKWRIAVTFGKRLIAVTSTIGAELVTVS